MRFAMSPEAIWAGNFRDLSSSVTRMATLAEAGGINAAIVNAAIVNGEIVNGEIARLQRQWLHHSQPAREKGDARLDQVMGATEAAAIDRFDALGLEAVINVCRESKSLSDAGRKLFNVSREAIAKPNDADRLKKYLTRFGLEWERVS